MKESWSRKLNPAFGIASKLAVVVTTGLLGELYVPSVFAAEYKQGMTGTTNDSQWLALLLLNLVMAPLYMILMKIQLLQ